MKLFKSGLNLTSGLLLFTLLTGCATIMNGSRQSVGISISPTNANVWLDRVYVGNSPLIIEMTRKDSHFVMIELEGYQPYEITFTRQASGWAFGNIIFGVGGIIGLAVDAVSGGLYKLTPDQIQAELRSNNSGYAKTSSQSYITIVLEPNPAWEKIGNLVAAK